MTNREHLAVALGFSEYEDKDVADIISDSLSKLEPFNLPMPITEFYINRCTMVVIGNIYDNPELMEVNKR